MNILALDASTKSTGYAIYVDNILKDYGTITASSSNVINRIQKIIQEIEPIISTCSFDYIVLEEVPNINNGNIKTLKALYWLQAALNFLFYEKIPKSTVKYFIPGEWRKKVGIHTGRGVTRDKLKKISITLVKNIYNIDCNDDVAEAILLGQAFINNSNEMDITWD